MNEETKTKSDDELVATVANFAFEWPLVEAQPALAMFNLHRDIPGHPKGSTVSRDTILTALGRLDALAPSAKGQDSSQTGGDRPFYGSTAVPEGPPADFAVVEPARTAIENDLVRAVGLLNRFLTEGRSLGGSHPHLSAYLAHDDGLLAEARRFVDSKKGKP